MGLFGSPGSTSPLPDGSLSLAKSVAVPGSIELSWDAACSTTAEEYGVYEGLLGDFASHTPSYCSTSGAMTHTFLPKLGDVYFLVAPRTVESEGSQGRGSDSLERDSLTYCVPRVLGVCP